MDSYDAQFALVASLSVLLPLAAWVPYCWASQMRAGAVLTRDDLSLGFVVYTSLGLMLLLLAGMLEPGEALGMLALLTAAGGYGWLESAWRLGTQTTIPCRVALVLLAYSLGYGFDLADRFGVRSAAGAFVLNFPPTLIFYLGLIMTLELLDRLRGLASGVAMIISLTLFAFVLRWAVDGWPLVMLAMGGVAVGLLAIQHGGRLYLGRSGQLQFAVLLAAATISSRSWGLTLPIVVVPLLAILLPMVDRIYMVFSRFSEGHPAGAPENLRSLMLDAGLGDRWVVFFIWIVTLQFCVLVKVVYATKSPIFALAAGLATFSLVLFVVAFVLRLGEKLERRRRPSRQRILFLSHYFHPEVNAPASRLHEHAARWVAMGHEVTVICPVPSAPHGRIYPGHANAIWQEQVVDGVRTIRVWTFLAANRGMLRRSLNYASFFASALLALLLVRRHDVLVATTPQFFCGLAGAVASFFRKETFLLEVRDLWPESIVAVGAARRGVVLGTVERLAGWMYRRAAAIVTVGPGYRSVLIDAYGLDPSRIHVVPNGVELETFHAPAPDAPVHPLRAQFGDRYVVAYVGTLGMAHGLEVALAAAEQLRQEDVVFLLVGDGAARAELESAARARDIRNVVFAGLLGKDQVPTVMAQCDAVLVHLRPCELFRTVLPSKLFEAMSMARPVLLGVDGDARAVLEQAGCGVYFSPGDAGALAGAVRQLRADPEAARAMGQRGAEFVRNHYTRDRFALQYSQLFTRQLARPPAPADPTSPVEEPQLWPSRQVD